MEFGDIPLELIANIIENLPLDDILNLLYTSKDFHDIYLLRKKLKEIGYDTEEDISIEDIKEIIRNRGKVYATGNNEYGQLGLESERSSDSEDTVGLPTVSLGDNNNNFRDRFTLVEVPSEYSIKQIITNDVYTYLLTEDGKVYATGDNKYGQLGLGNNNCRNRFTLVEGIPKIRKIIRNFLFT